MIEPNTTYRHLRYLFLAVFLSTLALAPIAGAGVRQRGGGLLRGGGTGGSASFGTDAAAHTAGGEVAGAAAAWPHGGTAFHADPDPVPGPGPAPDSADVPPVFTNGAWDPDSPDGPLNGYIAAVLAKDIYHKHIIDPRDGRAAGRNFSRFHTAFCRSMRTLGADECEAVDGVGGLVWALVRAGRSVLLVFRGSNTPENWISDITSLRMVNVGDFGGGTHGANVGLGFYKLFDANRASIVSRLERYTAAAASAPSSSAAVQGAGAGAEPGGAAPSPDRGGPRLWVAGHSLGGAVALMAAAHLDVAQGLSATGVYVYGCPHVGDATWARAYRLGAVTTRFEHEGDIVPSLPLGWGWTHVGEAVAVRACSGSGGGGGGSESSDDTGSSSALLEQVQLAELPAAAGDGLVSGWQQSHQEGATRADAARGLPRRALRGGLDATGAAATSHGPGSVTALAAVLASEDAAAADLEKGSEDKQDSEAAVAVAAAAAAASGALLEGSALGEGLLAEGDGEGPWVGDDAQGVTFPFPFLIRDHMVETYVRVMWGCLSRGQREQVPGPDDVYDRLAEAEAYGSTEGAAAASAW